MIFFVNPNVSESSLGSAGKKIIDAIGFDSFTKRLGIEILGTEASLVAAVRRGDLIMKSEEDTPHVVDVGIPVKISRGSKGEPGLSVVGLAPNISSGMKGGVRHVQLMAKSKAEADALVKEVQRLFESRGLDVDEDDKLYIRSHPA